jgi:hypothetical protein
VFESGAILLYLAEKSGRFMPRDPATRVAVHEWLMFQVGGFGPIPGQVHHFIAVQDEADRRYGLARFMAETRRLYGVMDRRLAAHEFFAGELSIADFAILAWVWRHARHQVDLADFPNVQRWYPAASPPAAAVALGTASLGGRFWPMKAMRHPAIEGAPLCPHTARAVGRAHRLRMQTLSPDLAEDGGYGLRRIDLAHADPFGRARLPAAPLSHQRRRRYDGAFASLPPCEGALARNR